jgi:hypothetical protein
MEMKWMRKRDLIQISNEPHSPYKHMGSLSITVDALYNEHILSFI